MSLRQDLSYTIRVLRKNPGFTAVAMLCMALGIGANSAIFSLADAILFRPLPVPDPGGVLTVRGTSPNDSYQQVSYADYTDLRAKCDSFQSLAAYAPMRLSYSPRAGVVSSVKLGMVVSGNFFKALGVEPAIGRGFHPQEDQIRDRDAVALISTALFKAQYNSDPSIIGGTMRLNAIDFTIVGVAPESFTGLDQYSRPEVYVPIMMAPGLMGSKGQDLLEKRDNRPLLLKGRLKPGVSQAAAAAELAVLSRNLEKSRPETNRGYTFLVRSELQERVDRSPPEAVLVTMLSCLAGFVLIIACANLANLLLSRARGRSREIALLLAGPGFRTDHLLMMSFDPTLAGYSPEQIQRFYHSLEEQARALPGVRRVVLTSRIPLGLYGDMVSIVPEGLQMPAGTASLPGSTAVVTPDYFDALRIPIVRGRGFQATDLESSPRVAVINQVMAEQFWPGEDPIGKRFRLGGPSGPWVEIVAVARNAKYDWIAEPPGRFFYLPRSRNYRSNMTLLIETLGEPAALAAPLRELVRSLDSAMPVFDVRTMDDFFDKRAVQIPAFIITMVASLGTLGLLLALVGLYGLTSYVVSRQTREIGIRMAIGAGRRGVLRQFLRQGLILSGSGILVGLAGVLASHQLMRAAFGLGPLDVAGMAVLPVVLLAITTLATLAPALRASRIDPLQALRYE